MPLPAELTVRPARHRAPPPPETHERRAITDVLVNVCNGETVSLTGELSEDTKVKGSKVEQHIKAHLTGTGSFGNAYKLELDVRSTWDTSAMTMTHKNRYDLKSEVRPRTSGWKSPSARRRCRSRSSRVLRRPQAVIDPAHSADQ